MKMTKIIKTGIIEDRINKNGLVFDKKDLNQIVEECKDSTKYVTLTNTHESIIDIRSVAATVEDAEVKDKELAVTCKILKTPMGKIMKSVIDYHGELYLFPRIVAETATTDGVTKVSNLKLISFNITDK